MKKLDLAARSGDIEHGCLGPASFRFGGGRRWICRCRRRGLLVLAVGHGPGALLLLGPLLLDDGAHSTGCRPGLVPLLRGAIGVDYFLVARYLHHDVAAVGRKVGIDRSVAGVLRLAASHG